ncbi:2,3-bisphosphoglycerate-dependent phosphoglycerate mutase [Actinopolyspora mzabensis]|uniref:2,3-bisphosphoglycerate-dependent phosphoglycerate mutase n=1 Tax=Actinopolyspora mzabensis TaxID=995066 RepID=A0A1G9E603_ACTMZ|nr:histidine phosphatase family protein [Actinopolyspora mzabensis]SDK71549.1 2,3-bisphosphoglycerate-dependent phosphoglycerate mutase [Actinopolyspora mzabensis]
MTLQRLVLWRHGETDYNLAGRIQGHLDSELTELGLEQAKRTAPLVAGFGPEVAVSSDLRRASTTAAAFAEFTGQEVRLDERLRETHLGQWQGLSGAEVEQGWPGAMGTWRTQPTWAPPDGETRVEVAERAYEVVCELDEVMEGTALLCAHGGLITALTARLLGWPTEIWSSLGGVGNCGWTVLSRSTLGKHGWRLTTYNGGFVE